MKRAPSATLRAITYTRVSTDEQGDSGLGLDAQATIVTGYATAHGWDVIEAVAEVGSARTIAKRPEFVRVLDQLRRGAADVLIVPAYDRMSRSFPEGVDVIATAERQGWSIVVCDQGLDTTTATGRFLAHVLLSAAEYQRAQTAQRTRDALAAAKARGIQIGRPPALPDEVRRRIISERAAGRTLRAIAEGLEADGTPTAHGGTWAAATVRRVLMSDAAQRVAA
jgi:DNA invertase Pin-like site-specific DNA recombinase